MLFSTEFLFACMKANCSVKGFVFGCFAPFGLFETHNGYVLATMKRTIHLFEARAPCLPLGIRYPLILISDSISVSSEACIHRPLPV